MSDILQRSPGRKPEPPSAELVAAVAAAHIGRPNDSVRVIAGEMGISPSKYYLCLKLAKAAASASFQDATRGESAQGKEKQI